MITDPLLSQGRMSAFAIRVTASLLVIAGAVGCEGGATNPVTNSPAGTVPGVSVPSVARLLSGNDQTERAGDWLPLPLVVLVADAGNRPLPNVRVDWRIVSGEGELASSPGLPLREPFTMTDQLGAATVFVRFTTLGAGLVVASVSNAAISPVAFSATVLDPMVLRINFGPIFDCMPSDPSGFYIGNRSADTVSVALGTTVEWQYWPGLHHSCLARLVSDAEPPGGERFDSRELAPGGTFRFVPTVAGTWKYGETINGGRGTLVVRAAP